VTRGAAIMRSLCTCRKLVLALSGVYLLCIVIATQKLYKLSLATTKIATHTGKI
jgi:hypothetical protein